MFSDSKWFQMEQLKIFLGPTKTSLAMPMCMVEANV